MSDTNYDLKAAYGVLKKIYLAFLVGPILFLFVAIIITDGAGTSTFDMDEPLNLALIIITAIAISMGSLVSRRIFASAKPEDDARKKMAVFQSGIIIRIASYEGVELFSIVVFIITGNIIVLLFAAISIVGILTSYPRPTYIRQTVGISEIDLI